MHGDSRFYDPRGGDCQVLSEPDERRPLCDSQSLNCPTTKSVLATLYLNDLRCRDRKPLWATATRFSRATG